MTRQIFSQALFVALGFFLGSLFLGWIWPVEGSSEPVLKKALEAAVLAFTAAVTMAFVLTRKPQSK